MARKSKVENAQIVFAESPEIKLPVLNSLGLSDDYIPEEAKYFGEEYFNNLKTHGMDVSFKGAWQKMYAYFIDKIFQIKDKRVIDIGGACGSLASAFSDYGAKSTVIDISKYAIDKSPFKNIEKICAPVWNLTKLESNSVDFVHAMFSFNYIPSKLIHQSLQEINRVCKDGAIVFSIMNLDNEDKIISEKETIYSKTTWDRQAANFGMKCGVKAYYQKMFNLFIPGWEFMKKYNWKFLLYKVCKGV